MKHAALLLLFGACTRYIGRDRGPVSFEIPITCSLPDGFDVPMTMMEATTCHARKRDGEQLLLGSCHFAWQDVEAAFSLEGLIDGVWHPDGTVEILAEVCP